jgi:ubiquinol-cytochrome c reductase cytochrome b subunit
MSWSARFYKWLDERLGISTVILPIIEHPVPDTDWWYVLGSATLIAFVNQVLTGVALAMSYVPAPNSAYDSLNFITHEAVLGSLLRGIHYFGASAMVILIAAHAAHAFLIGSYKFPRELNWFTGTLLLFLTLGMAFTGQLLRWDQDAYWAVVVAAEQVGKTPLIGDQLAELVVAGQTVGGATLTRFYATHVFVIPALMFLLIATHLYLVIQVGVSEVPTPGEPVDPATYQKRYHDLLEREGIPFFPDAAWKDVVFAVAVGAIVILLSTVVGPPELGLPADPTIIQAYPRPDWYFLWYFALLALIPNTVENLFILGFPLTVGIIFLILPFVANRGERSPQRRPWAIAIVGIAALGIAVLVRQGQIAPWSPAQNVPPLPASVTANLTPQEQHGALVYQRAGCSSCHAIAGVGGIKGPDLTYVASRLSSGQITARILAGGNGMPAYAGNLSATDTTDVVAFLETRRSP